MRPDPEATRTEHDSLGEVAVPASAKWAAQTQRAVDNFPISGRAIDRRLIRALGLIKAAGARVNARIDEVASVDEAVAEAIAAAADEVAEGRWDAEFPVDVFQTGSGTSSNMNANEVIARLATERLGDDGGGGADGGGAVHPNDQVNASQSSNDVFPSAVHLAATEAVTHELLPALHTLTTALSERSEAFGEVVKAGRTHLMDATPVTLGQEFGGYAAQLEEANERFRDSLGRLARLPIGGTAVGTGINAPADFGAQMVAELGERIGLPLSEAPDHFAAQGARDGLVEMSGQLRALATSLVKIANDVRWLSSGPRCGLAEIRLPALQPGSSIMPGKVNPVLAETVVQVAGQVIGNDAAVAFGNSQGNLELNVTMPMMARNLLESVELLSNAMTVFAERCVAGIEADAQRCRELAETSPSVVTSLNPVIGYEAASDVVKESLASGRSIREVILERDLLAPGELDEALDVMALTRGGLV